MASTWAVPGLFLVHLVQEQSITALFDDRTSGNLLKCSSEEVEAGSGDRNCAFLGTRMLFPEIFQTRATKTMVMRARHTDGHRSMNDQPNSPSDRVQSFARNHITMVYFHLTLSEVYHQKFRMHNDIQPIAIKFSGANFTFFRQTFSTLSSYFSSSMRCTRFVFFSKKIQTTTFH